jgi:hypothetical protein
MEIVRQVLPLAFLGVSAYIAYKVVTTDFRVPPPEQMEAPIKVSNPQYPAKFAQVSGPVAESHTGTYVYQAKNNVYFNDKDGQLKQ